MNKPFDAAEIIRAVGIRLEESRQSVATEKDRIEREIGLQFKATVAEFRQREAEREATMLRMEQSLAERMARLRDGQDGKEGAAGPPGERGEDGAPGPPGEPGSVADIPTAPDDVAVMIERALGILADPIVRGAEAGLVININGPDAGARRKTITMRRDVDGNAVADVIEQGAG
jgi:hypothetical protein